jgi:hypothetical protein
LSPHYCLPNVQADHFYGICGDLSKYRLARRGTGWQRQSALICHGATALDFVYHCAEATYSLIVGTLKAELVKPAFIRG